MAGVVYSLLKNNLTPVRAICTALKYASNDAKRYKGCIQFTNNNSD